LRRDSSRWTSTLNLGFELVRKLDVGTLQQYSNANPQYEQENFDAISKCLNMVISKTFDDSKLYRQAANKFFVKDAQEPLLFPNKTPHSLLKSCEATITQSSRAPESSS
jgi:hypothetical protein